MPVLSFDEAIAAAVAKATKGNPKFTAEEQKLFEKTLAEDPELKGGWLRQDDYGRSKTELQKKEAEVAARDEQLNDWADKTLPKWETLKEKGIIGADDEPIWETRLSTLEKERDDARAAALAGGDMKPEELEKRVKDIVEAAGGATKAEVDALYKSEARKIAVEEFGNEWKKKETDFNTNTIPFINGFATATAVMATRYEKETGEPWTKEVHEQMHAKMNKDNEFDPYKVVDEMIKPFREKKKTDEDVEARVQARLAEERQSRRAETGGSDDYIPQPGEGKGALREMLDRSAKKEEGGGDFEALIRDKAREAAQQLAAGK